MRRCLVPLTLIAATALVACGGSSYRPATATPRVIASATPNTRAATATPPSSATATLTPAPPVQTPTATPLAGASGIEGHVTIGPTCPVQRIDSPCPDRPYEATIVVLGADRNSVAETRSDAAGRFRVVLPPGTYILSPQTTGVPPSASEQTVTVVAGVITEVEIVFDSGIR